VTGVTVWDPMDIKAATGLAKMIMQGISWLVSIFREDKRVVRATDEEINSFAKGLQDMTYRRFNAIGSVSDILLVVAALGMFIHRAASMPAEKKEQAAPAQQPLKAAA